MIEVICATRVPHRSHQWNEGNAVYDCSGVEPYPNGGSRADAAALPFREAKLGLSDQIASVTRDAQVFQSAFEIAEAKMMLHSPGSTEPDAAKRKWWSEIAAAVREGRNSLLMEQGRLMRGTDALLADVAAEPEGK